MFSKQTTRTSVVWNHFTPKPGSDIIAICKICKASLSFKSSSNNLKKHILRKHPLVKIEIEKHEPPSQICDGEQASGSTEKSCQENSPLEEISINMPSTSRGKRPQTAMTNYLRKKIGIFEKKKLDEKLLQLIIKDFQPLSIVEDSGFKDFVLALNPSYQLPSRKTISTTLLTTSYEMVYNETKNIMKMVKAVTLTTDCWTSRNTENFLAVTAHFIDDNFRLKSVLLKCISFGERHTAENLSVALKTVILEWELENKILMIVSDNASNIKKAIVDLLKQKHYGCFAHTINLIVHDALHHIAAIAEKVKTIVTFFKRSTSATAKFFKQQEHLNIAPKKLIQDVATRWNSTFYMFERFLELEEPLRTTMALIEKNLPIISQEEWVFLKEMVLILRPLENITNVMSGQSYLTASSVIILTDGLINIFEDMKRKEFTDLSQVVISAILDGIKNRLGGLESSNSLTLATFLDPRFKILGFSNDMVCERVKKHVISAVTQNINVRESEKEKDKNIKITDRDETSTAKGGQSVEKFSIWGSFDKKKLTFHLLGLPTPKL